MPRVKDKPKKSLSRAIVLPFLSLILLTGAAVGWLSFDNGRRAVTAVADELRSEINRRIKSHLRQFLDDPHNLLKLNAMAIGRGAPDPGNQAGLQRRFWEQVQVHKTITSIHFGNTEGGLATGGKKGPGGVEYVIGTEGFKAGPFTMVGTDAKGNLLQPVLTLADYDARTRPWYKAALEKGGAAWGEIYILFTGHDMAIAPSRPVYDAGGRLLGVAAADLFLSHIGDFLAELHLDRPGLTYILEPSGLLVASSTGEQPFRTIAGDKPSKRRLLARESAIAVVRKSARFLDNALRTIHTDVKTGLRVEGELHHLDVTPINDPYGLSWIIVTAIPESAYMGDILAGNRTAAALIALALAVTLLVGAILSGRIVRPILSLNAAARGIAAGDLTTRAPVERRDEVGELSLAFNRMAAQLRESFQVREEQLKEISAAEGRFRQLADNIQEVFWISDVEKTTIFYVSPAYETIWGRPIQSLYDRPHTWLEAVHPDDRNALREASLTKEVNGEFHEEYRILRPDGEVRWIRDRAFPVRDADGEVTRIAGIAEDVTVRKQAETEQERLAEALRHAQKMEAVGVLAGGIAHDFNNILGAVIGYAELARLRAADPESQNHLDQVLSSAERARTLVQQLLTFSRRQGSTPQPVKIAEVVLETLGLIRATTPATIDIQTTLLTDGAQVLGDPTQLHQVVMNLLTNAVQAIGDKVGTVAVTLERGDPPPASREEWGLDETAHFLQLEVRDSGTGIDPEEIHRIFDPFYTNKPVGKGSGLGLAVVHGIVSGLGGAIVVEGLPGTGAIFQVFLPESDAETPLPAAEATFDAPLKGRILLVDDETALIDVGGQMLESLGLEAETSSRPEEALRLIEEAGDRFDAVITDQSMPGMSGVELGQRIMELHPRLPVIIATGFSDSVSADRADALGFAAFLQKPLSLQSFREALAPLLKS